MSQYRQDDLIIWQLERLLYLLKERQEAGVVALRPCIRPIQTWDEQTRHFGSAEKVKLHRYPGGLANTTRWRRDHLVAAWRKRTEGMDERGLAESQAIHEGLANAVDAERFLGSLDQEDDCGRFSPDAVNEISEHLLVWLRERGTTLCRCRRGETDHD